MSDPIAKLVKAKEKFGDIPFGVTGSVACLLRGLDVQPNDLDVFCHQEYKERVQKMFPGEIDFNLGDERLQHHGEFDLDVIFRDDLGERTKMEVGGVTVWVHTLEELLRIYKKLDRKEKIQLIEGTLQNETL